MPTFIKKISLQEFNKIDLTFHQFKQVNFKNKNLKAFYKMPNITISIFKNFTLLIQTKDKIIKKIQDIFVNYSQIKIPQKKHNFIDGYVGMDEVGTGDYFGPIITCSCFLPNEKIDFVKKLGVVDSKKLNDSKILIIANKLQKNILYDVSICMPKMYNFLIKKYNNINIVKAICHNNALNKLIVKIKNKKYKIILDQFVPKNKYYQYLSQIKTKKIINIDVFETKAENKFLSVACASIIARAIFVMKINELSKLIKITIPKGASQIEKIVKIGKIIKKNNKLDSFAKLNFKCITNKINS